MHINEDLLIYVLNALMGILGFIIAILLRRLEKVIDVMKHDHAQLIKKVEEHREDVLKNYVTSNDLTYVKDDIIRNIKSLEDTMVALIGRRKDDRG